MGYMKEKRLEGRKKVGVAPGKAPRTGFGALVNTGGRPALGLAGDWGDMIDAVVDKGDCLIFARTRNGNCLVLTLKSDDGDQKAYISDAEQLQDAWDWLADNYVSRKPAPGVAEGGAGAPLPATS